MTKRPRREPKRGKERLTITLSPDVLARLDAAIDGQRMRNRSHAIELLLRQALTPAVTTAVILAGGDHPGGANPAMANIDGEELIVRTVSHLVRHGIERFVVVGGSDVDDIEGVLGDGSDLGAETFYLRERRPRGTAGALKLAAPLLGEEAFLVVHGDVLTNIDVRDLLEFHDDAGTLATMAVKPRRSERTYGRVTMQGARITAFDADGATSDGISIVNAGVYVVQPQVLSLIDDRRPSMLEDGLFPTLARMGELTAFVFQGLWFDIRDPKKHQLAETRWKQTGGLHAHD